MELDTLLNAIYKTLLHSLWQGVILAVLGGAVMVLGKKLKSSTKYLLLTFSLVLFSVVMLFTFTLELTTNSIFVADTQSSSSQYLPEIENIQEEGFIFSMTDKIHVFYDYYIAHYDRVLVFVWFAIICIKIATMFFDVRNVYKLKNAKRKPVSVELQRLFKTICHKMDLKKGISVFESGIAKTPMVIGVIKPMVLIPIGLLTSMTPEQVEAILAHELAHIKRKDFMVNLIQSGMEIIFFFNPFVIWISSVIRKERELCCDDIAIELTGDKMLYANTLVECKEYRSPVYSMNFVSNRKPLLNRVRRILGLSKSSLSRFDRFFVGLCFIALVFTTAILTTNPWRAQGSSHYFLSSFSDSQASKIPNRVDAEEIIKQLVDDRIISNPENFSFKVTNFALYVDGNRQSKALHRQILLDFVKDYERRLHFTKSVISESD